MRDTLRSVGAMLAGVIAFAIVTTLLTTAMSALVTSPAPQPAGQPPVTLPMTFFFSLLMRELLAGAALGVTVGFLAPRRPLMHVAPLAGVLFILGSAMLFTQQLPASVLAQDLCLPAANSIGSLASAMAVTRRSRRLGITNLA